MPRKKKEKEFPDLHVIAEGISYDYFTWPNDVVALLHTVFLQLHNHGTALMGRAGDVPDGAFVRSFQVSTHDGENYTAELVFSGLTAKASFNTAMPRGFEDDPVLILPRLRFSSGYEVEIMHTCPDVPGME